MKRILQVFVVMLMLIGLCSCTKMTKITDEVTVPDFEVMVNGVKVTDEMMASYDVYEIVVETVDNYDNVDNTTYHGYRALDIIKAAGFTGSPKKMTIIPSDGADPFEVANPKASDNLFSFERKKSTDDAFSSKKGPFFAPCSSKNSPDYIKFCGTINVE